MSGARPDALPAVTPSIRSAARTFSAQPVSAHSPLAARDRQRSADSNLFARVLVIVKASLIAYFNADITSHQHIFKSLIQGSYFVVTPCDFAKRYSVMASLAWRDSGISGSIAENACDSFFPASMSRN